MLLAFAVVIISPSGAALLSVTVGGNWEGGWTEAVKKEKYWRFITVLTNEVEVS